MKVLLLEDVYKLGRAGDVKKVADGFGRNYLIPHGLAVLATPGALKQVEHIRTQATAKRAALNEELSSVAAVLSDMTLTFPARAGETGKLYGSITTQMIAEAIEGKTEVQLDRRQIDTQPLRSLGEHSVLVRLTMDLVPEIKVIVYREGESLELDETPAEMAESDSAIAEVSDTLESEVELEEEETPESSAEDEVEPGESEAGDAEADVEEEESAEA